MGKVLYMFREGLERQTEPVDSSCGLVEGNVVMYTPGSWRRGAKTVNNG